MWPAHEDYVTTWPGSAGRVVQPGRLTDGDAEFVIGLAVPHITHTTFREEDGTRAAWFYPRNDRSWAAVRWPEENGPGTVYQHGPWTNPATCCRGPSGDRPGAPWTSVTNR